VYVLYWTAFQDADGNIAFRDDIYDRDQRLIAALSGQRVAEGPTPPIECNA
jgi:murein L,D-transpeptidase YcbB/YkuD